MVSEVNGTAPAGLEYTFTLYRMLDERWRKTPLFLRRNLSYNLHPLNPDSAPSACNTPPSETKPLQPPAGAQSIQSNRTSENTDFSEGQSVWELEISASVWVAPNAPQTLASVGAQLRSKSGVPHLPLFVAFSEAGPVTQADGHIFPVRSFHFRRVPVVQTTKEQAKLVLPLPNTAAGPPQGKLLCIVWDNPDEIRMLGQESFSAQHPVPPLDGVPFGRQGVWAHASIPSKTGAPSNSMPVLRRSTISCKHKADCFGAHFIHVQAAPVLQATLRMKMELRRREPATNSQSQPNGVQIGTPQPLPPSVPRPPSSVAAQQVVFVYESGDPIEHVLEVTTGWRCPICRRRSPGYEALQLHLLGVHHHFQILFQQSDGRPVVYLNVAEQMPDAKAGNVPSCPAYGTNVEYVHWRGSWSSPQAAFLALRRKEMAERQARDKKRQAQSQPVPETDGETSVKRQRSATDLEPQHDLTDERARGLDEKPAVTSTAAGEEESKVRGLEKDEPAERPAPDEPGAPATGQDGREHSLAGELAECLDAAGASDYDPPPPPKVAWSQQGANDTDRDSGTRGEEGGRALQFRQWLNGNLEPHQPSPEPELPSLVKLRGRSESVGPASSAGDSGAGALQLATRQGEMQIREGGSGGTKIVPVKKKGGSKAKRKPLDTDRNMENLQSRTFYHSRTGMPIDLDTVLHGPDSEDDLDEDELQWDDRRMLNDFTDVSLDEKEIMIMWNCFARQQRIAADAHMSWASRAFAEVHKEKIGTYPALRRVFMLMLVKFWNCALISAEDLDDCLKTVDSANDD